ncbi:MAG: HD domain-containing protein [Desulfotignum sp.]|nr:HD domain-containing protein [Desulfotignum sp.]MCF8114316.1 HD domain-containing protein [Desulfotignum sp.]MCF8125422.1 HD domain-containing protein [Desulfotignum sp.]
MKIPTRKQCFQLIQSMGMMDHIVDHSVMVGNVTLCLCRHLKQTTPSLNVELATAAALLHDITKTRSFDTGELHSETGGKLLENLGYPEVGNIIRQHVILDVCKETAPISEQEIVNYADKRVLHDSVVSLSRRLAYIRVKYGNQNSMQDRIDMMWKMTVALEKKLFRQISFLPAQLQDSILPDIKPL